MPAYAASYFARGFLAGHKRLGLYGGLVFIESISRCMFALVVAVGSRVGQSVWRSGMAAAPLLSLSVVPWALRATCARAQARAAPREAADVAALDEAPAEAEFTLAHGTGFAAAVLLIMVAEQTFLNAGR